MGKKNNLPEFIIQRGYLAAYSGTDNRIIIPDGVTCIGKKVFYGCKADSVVIPASVAEIERDAFAYSMIKEVKVVKSVAKIGLHAFPNIPEIANCIYPIIPIRNFSKADREAALRYFIIHFCDIKYEKETEISNIGYIGKNMLKPFASGLVCDEIATHMELMDEVIAAKAISNKDIDALVDHFQERGQIEAVTKLLSYKVLNHTKVFPNISKISSDMNIPVSEWRQKYRFKYTDGVVEITGCMLQQNDIEVPAQIGNRNVEIIGRKAFDGHILLDHYTFEQELDYKRKIVLPDSVREIKSGAFYCVNNRELFLPKSIKQLPVGMMVAVRSIVIHVSSDTKVPDDLVWDSAATEVEVVRDL